MGKDRAQKLLDKLISESEFMARNPKAKEVDLYKRIKSEFEIGAKDGFISQITIPSSKNKTTKRSKVKAKTRSV